ncbi:1-deoxy-D-xylulose-5-phosphate reductoisomerase [Alsobacter sp. SYSU M60028]|uniref:1-deoxy-D-xylulose 5-phosphate reductoisomerase n=1 Tax=Alsobacter ponti TaxID=2962936 RepID=A0ABT1LB85_9HYPH|nr:1-deoxy-D-xylulose-5-phosphate reductoisomerase [Alsobacter ponti]MCP8938213.1 1-deoxy-D-xylulose-5-phosphate reductoisomerase [Alsobacter ponti]
MTVVSVLGATGSIGRSTADIIESQGETFTVEAVAGGRDAAALAAMALRLRARFAALADPAGLPELRDALAGSGIASGAGEEAVIEAASRPADIVVAGIAGSAGVAPTHAAVRLGRTVALANKECLVCAGEAFMRDAARAGATLLPMDSEHNAIAQALGRHTADDVESMVLTASGGPFRTWPAERIANATREEALAHPNWSMGAKISVDSASLMNKGLELIEAHHLFGVPAERLSVLVHPQSIVHGLVGFRDGSVVAGLACPDMRVPIAHCLGNPHRLATAAPRLDLAAVARLEFEAPDLARFPALRLAIEAMNAGGAAPTVLNAANEVAVAAFLAGALAFGAIPRLVEETLERMAGRYGSDAPRDVAAALELDVEARRIACEIGGIAAKLTD